MTAPSHTPESILAEAINLAAPEQRAEYLSRACGDDHELRAEVERLVQDHFAAGDFLEEPAACVVDDLTNGDGQAQEQPGSWIGPYKLHEQIGEGGFGVVYLAVQEKPVRRQVALKIIKPGMDTKQVIARFEAERQALALMNHANIAQVLDAGETETGRPYFVMELVKGIPITEYCDQCNLTTHERLKLFMSLCNAVQHAHQKAIIHRDIKPTNVLVVFQDGEPTVKIIDFGVAKALNQRLTDRTLETGFAQMLGTPLYMSPEQAEMSTLDVDTRTDVYSLGVLLYELLTGTTPFTREQLDNATYDEIRNMIRREDPPRPSARLSTLGEQATTISERRRTDVRKLRQLYQGDLDWIVMRCLEKDRTRRYETANDLARDVGRFIGGEPVEARPPSIVYRLGKFARRNRGGLAAGLAAVVAVVASVVGLAVSNALIKRERDVAVADRKRAEEAEVTSTQLSAQLRRQLYVSDINLAYQSYHEGNVARAVELLDRQRPRVGATDHRSIEWNYLHQMCERSQRVMTISHGAGILAADLSGDDRTLATAGDDGMIKLWDLANGELLRTLKQPTRFVHPYSGPLATLKFSPDGSKLVFCTEQGIRLWELATGRLVETPDFDARRVAFSNSGELTALASQNRVATWNMATGDVSVVHQYKDRGAMFALEFSPDDSKLAWTRWGQTLLWERGRGIRQISQNSWATPVVFSPSGKLLVRGGKGPPPIVIEVWDLAHDEIVSTLPFPDSSVHCMALTSDGQTIAASGDSGDIWMWNLSTGEHLGILRGHGAILTSLIFTSDDEWLISTSSDGTARRWRPRADETPIVIRGTEPWAPTPIFCGDSRSLIVLKQAKFTEDAKLMRYDLPSGQLLRSIDITQPALYFAFGGRWAYWLQQPGGSRFLVGSPGQPDRSQVWDAETGRTLATIDGRIEQFGPLSFSPDGTAVVKCVGDVTSVFDVETGAVIVSKSLPARSIGFTDDGRLGRLHDSTLHFLDRDTLHTTSSVRLEADPREMHMFAQNGARLIASSNTETCLWDVATGRKLAVLEGPVHPRLPSTYFAFSRGGSRLAVGSGTSAAVAIFDPHTGIRLGTLRGHRWQVSGVAFSSDGQTLVTSSADGTVKLWRMDTFEEVATLHDSSQGVFSMAMADDGSLAIGLAIGDVYVWRNSQQESED